MTGAERVTVFGGTGFLGRRVVRELHAAGFAVRVASRHPERAEQLFASDGHGMELVFADVGNDLSVAEALSGSFAAVNAVSLYVERGRATFVALHVEAAARVARLAHQNEISRFVHVSGIGADPKSRSRYIASRGAGELAVRDNFPGAIVVRPAVMFGAGDALVAPLAGMLRRFRVFALFGHGRTRLQPVYADDVAAAIARLVVEPHPAPLYELGGPQLLTYRELLQAIAAAAQRRVLFVPLPFALWSVIGALGEMFASPPLTRNQVELMQHDNVASPDLPGFTALGLLSRSPEELLPRLVRLSA
jgi:uncharacterized protein YbjT (DUF2867 family)